MKRVITLVLALLMIISFTACSEDELKEPEITEAQGTSTGSGDELKKEAAPDFTVYDRSGEKVTLSSKKGTPVVLNFWASWCYPCKSEMPEFNEVCAEFEGRVEFMMVNLTDGVQETEAEAKGFIDQEGYSFPVYFDKDSDAANKYGIQSIPTTFFIDAEGNLIAYVTGAIQKDTLKKGISMIYTEENDK